MQEDGWHVSGLSVGQVAERMNIAPSAVRWYADHGLLPSEVGTIHTLPAVDMTTGPDGKPVFTPRPPLQPQAHGLLGHLVAPFVDAKQRVEEGVKRHNINVLIAGLEQEKTQDVATLQGAS